MVSFVESWLEMVMGNLFEWCWLQAKIGRKNTENYGRNESCRRDMHHDKTLLLFPLFCSKMNVRPGDEGQQRADDDDDGGVSEEWERINWEKKNDNRIAL